MIIINNNKKKKKKKKKNCFHEDKVNFTNLLKLLIIKRFTSTNIILNIHSYCHRQNPHNQLFASLFVFLNYELSKFRNTELNSD